MVLVCSWPGKPLPARPFKLLMLWLSNSFDRWLQARCGKAAHACPSVGSSAGVVTPPNPEDLSAFSELEQDTIAVTVLRKVPLCDQVQLAMLNKTWRRVADSSLECIHADKGASVGSGCKWLTAQQLSTMTVCLERFSNWQDIWTGEPLGLKPVLSTFRLSPDGMLIPDVSGAYGHAPVVGFEFELKTHVIPEGGEKIEWLGEVTLTCPHPEPKFRFTLGSFAYEGESDGGITVSAHSCRDIQPVQALMLFFLKLWPTVSVWFDAPVKSIRECAALVPLFKHVQYRDKSSGGPTMNKHFERGQVKSRKKFPHFMLVVNVKSCSHCDRKKRAKLSE